MIAKYFGQAVINLDLSSLDVPFPGANIHPINDILQFSPFAGQLQLEKFALGNIQSRSHGAQYLAVLIEAVTALFLQIPQLTSFFVVYPEFNSIATTLSSTDDIGFRHHSPVVGVDDLQIHLISPVKGFRIDDRLAEILGYQTAELSPMNAAKWNELTHPQDLEKSDQQLDAHRAGQQEFYACELRMRHKNGHYVWVFDQGKVNEWDHQGQPLIMLGAIQEITERKQLENDLIESELRYRSLIESSCDVIFCLDKYGNFRFTNSAFAAAYHKTPEYFSDKSLWDVFPKDEADRRQEINARVFATGNDFTSEEIFATHAGNVHHLTTRNPVKNPTGEVVLNMIRAVDISQRKSIEEETRRLSFTDTLTGVYNRNYFEATLTRLSGSREYPVTIISVDLDGLKLVNDTKGHRQGDYLLQTCARLLKSALRSSDILTRVGGDEFAIFLPQTNVPSGKEILRRIHSMIDDHNRASKDIFLSMSLGMATAEEAGTDLEHTYKRSDDKMYHNKAVKKRP